MPPSSSLHGHSHLLEAGIPEELVLTPLSKPNLLGYPEPQPQMQQTQRTSPSYLKKHIFKEHGWGQEKQLILFREGSTWMEGDCRAQWGGISPIQGRWQRRWQPVGPDTPGTC